ncbi:MAG TPA: lysophospholipid acyltransferase family protein [Gaiellaceae bacterium]|nr:lysophospholipid acyltransferase family protein [Gaiellaceae bacterium]
MAGTDSSSKPSLLYRAIARASSPVVYGLFRLRTEGRENVPQAQGFVLAANHLSNFDPWPLGLALYPRPLRFMAKAELYKPVLGAILGAVGAFPIRRGERDPEAYRTAVRLAQDGEIVAMFPEGTRRAKGARKKWVARPHPGAARIALAAGVPLVPAAVTGGDSLARLGPLRVRIGRPIETADLVGIPRRKAAERATERLMKRIAELEGGS